MMCLWSSLARAGNDQRYINFSLGRCAPRRGTLTSEEALDDGFLTGVIYFFSALSLTSKDRDREKQKSARKTRQTSFTFVSFYHTVDHLQQCERIETIWTKTQNWTDYLTRKKTFGLEFSSELVRGFLLFLSC